MVGRNDNPPYVCKNKPVKKAFYLLVIIFFAACQEAPTTLEQHSVINRDPSSLVYSKHARCRMNCRHIDESEVADILRKGRINYRKSVPAARPDPKYALEGTTGDGQHVRIVFANAKRGTVVVTVIDLDRDWQCHCK